VCGEYLTSFWVDAGSQVEVHGGHDTVLVDVELVEVMGAGRAAQTRHRHHRLRAKLGVLATLVDCVSEAQQHIHNTGLPNKHGFLLRKLVFI